MKLFVHGVPDTGFMWGPVIGALGLAEGEFRAPDMPGFDGTTPRGFAATKEAYLEWLVSQLRALAAEFGPVDIVGHDWGAPLTAMAAYTAPDLVRSWTVINAVPEPSYEWHDLARTWQTPIKGELFMALGTVRAFQKSLVEAGMPAEIAAHDAPRIDRHMKRAILKLYRSAKRPADWDVDFAPVAAKGAVLWGAGDPFVPVKFARRFCDRWGVPLVVEEGVGHWGLCERPAAFAGHLRAHWDAVAA